MRLNERRKDADASFLCVSRGLFADILSSVVRLSLDGGVTGVEGIHGADDVGAEGGRGIERHGAIGIGEPADEFAALGRGHTGQLDAMAVAHGHRLDGVRVEDAVNLGDVEEEEEEGDEEEEEVIRTRPERTDRVVDVRVSAETKSAGRPRTSRQNAQDSGSRQSASSCGRDGKKEEVATGTHTAAGEDTNASRWKSKDFLEIDDDMEFEFMDL